MSAMLEVANLSTAYGRIEALKGISLTVPPGQIVALLGANGAGKTTTLKSIAGLLTPQSGSIHLEGQALIGLSTAKVVRKGVSLVPQERELFPGMSAIDNLMLGAFTRKDSAAVQADLDRVLQLFPVLGERRRQAAGTLSGGERQMLAIGRALMARPKLLLLDEPSLGVAPLVVKEIFAAIGRINREGTAILLVEQKVTLALALAHYAYVLEVGRVALEGPANELAARGGIRKLYLG
jgi:branched-chain amino acid transport system ATP-binding protein